MLNKIEYSDWLSALQAATRDQTEDAYTSEELRERIGCCTAVMRRMLRHAKEAGKIECVQVLRETISGVRKRVPAYRLVRQKKGKQ